jgi:hypothetical protein
VDQAELSASDRVREAVSDALRRVGPPDTSMESVLVPVTALDERSEETA